MKIVAEYVGDKPFSEMTKDDVKDLVAEIQERDIAEATFEGYKKIIRFFWKWMSDEDEYPEEVDWIEYSSRSQNGTLPKDLLTKEEVQSQIQAAGNARDKAFIAVLYETGARIGELIELTVGDVEDNDHGKKVVVDGKTGSRRIPLVESVPHLNRWLSEHPKPDKDSPLWCKIRGEPEQVGYNYLRLKVLQKTAKEADIDKDVNPHHYRHSRASHLANEMTEAQLCEWFGWSQSSDVPARYVHLSGRDIDDAYKSLHGIVDEEDEEDEPSVTECPRCDELNEPNAAFCRRCGFALDRDMAEEVERLEDQTVEGVEPDDMKIAQEVVKVMQDNPDKLTKALESLK
jgi:site-specific recombinase XerD